MKKIILRILVTALCISLLAVPAAAVQSLDTLVEEGARGLSAMNGREGKLLAGGEDFPAGASSSCDWAAMALAISGAPEQYGKYLAALEDYVEAAYAANGGLERVKSTTYHRVALTVLALGGDPTAFGQKSDGTPIDLIADGTYAFAGESVGQQGLNGWIYALIALDASGVTPPADARFTREDMIAAILTAQESDGGFGLIGGNSSVDITAMALQALAPYAQQYPVEIEAAVNYLAAGMSEGCVFSSFGDVSAESSAQVILALCALGIDPEQDARFTQNGLTLLSGVERFRQSDGSFSHLAGDTAGDLLASAQMLLALKALQDLRSGEGWIFDFSDYEAPATSGDNVFWIAAAAAAAAVAVIIIVIITGKRKNHGKTDR